MFKIKFVAVAVAAAVAFAPVSAVAQRVPGGGVFGGSSSASGVIGLAGCVLSIMIAATDKGNRYKKELTTDEAITCGLLYWLKEANRR
ncbi:MAG: hypothetical protein K2P86_13545 [Xanthobacteraceae bacterium]|nr:hypothetical protein [Xanthobacteraceae bacterium]